MTHDELLAICDNYSFKDSAEPVKALRAVVELHKPYESTDMGLICAFCKDMNSVEYWYPCPTIQQIIENLK